MSILFYILTGVLIVISIYLAVKTEILKDLSCQAKGGKPYSFARTQLFWWTLIVVSAFIIAFGTCEHVVELNRTCLILLGISLGTTATSRVIDNTQINADQARHQDFQTSGSFLVDILSDENGISVHRFQALVFNVIFGVIFIVEFFQCLFNNVQYPEFGSNELTLMGISSGAYLGLKMNENNAKDVVENAKTERGATAEKNDELLDLEPVSVNDDTVG